MLHSHFLTLVVFSSLVACFFGTLSRETPREAVKVGGIMFACMVGISILVAYLMYFFPLD
jgi:hypothetical protein